jgi:SAM-dependent methyltransferase
VRPEEYTRLARIDREHWFYRGKRAIVRHWLLSHLRLDPSDLLVDAGCGTGTWLVDMAAACEVLGVDRAFESLAIAGPRAEAAGAKLVMSALDRLPLAAGCAAAVTALDVLEHLDDDDAALSELERIVRPGGLLLLTVPALAQLWSDWDVSLGHRRRYHRRQLLNLVDRPGSEVLTCRYFNTLALPAILAVRRRRSRRPGPRGSERLEDRIPPRALNAALYASLVWPARRWWPRLPTGVSLLAVLRRR